MIRYSPASQLSFDNFSVPSLQKLNPKNRWVVMAELMPWDELAMVFVASPTAPTLNGQGRPTLDLRLVMGALLVQQIEGLSDERTLELINENVYVQFFCGLPGYKIATCATCPDKFLWFDVPGIAYIMIWLFAAGSIFFSVYKKRQEQ